MQAVQSSALEQAKKEEDRKKDQEAKENKEREDAEARKAQEEATKIERDRQEKEARTKKMRDGITEQDRRLTGYRSVTVIAASIVTDALKTGEEPPACVADMKGGARRVMMGVENWMLDQEEDGEVHTLDCRVLGALTRAPYTTCENVAWTCETKSRG